MEGSDECGGSAGGNSGGSEGGDGGGPNDNGSPVTGAPVLLIASAAGRPGAYFLVAFFAAGLRALVTGDSVAPHTVSVSRRATTYGSQLALGRRSSA